VKLIFDEPGSDLAAELWDRAEMVVSSTLVYPEGRAAIGAAARAGRFVATEEPSAVATFEQLYAELRVLGIDEPLARRAGDLAVEHALRGYDAVHLASALQVAGADVVLATWDRALSAAARATGVLAINELQD
jgi:predicted nucleic acid-binding protein